MGYGHDDVEKFEGPMIAIQVCTSDEKLRTDRQQARSDGVRGLLDQGGSTRDGSRSLPRPR
jgi:hypothetical protein